MANKVPGVPDNPYPGMGLAKPHFFLFAVVIFALGFFGQINLLGAILFGLLLLTWSIDNDYFDYA
ncbi:MAG: hypothetical protein Q8P02_00165 [Candidatus Micrarchaeota archaeon]|nr:hypothetical protein [Candidatus Micrarchaeota archaeon]